MSIEVPLFQALAILHKNPEKCAQKTTFQTQNAGCWKQNQKIWSSVFARKKVVKLKNFQQFQPRFAASVMQTVGGFCASSDASSESGKNDILKLSLSLPNEAQEVVKKSEMGDAIEGPEIEDGDGPGGGDGQGKNTGGFGGSGGGDEDLHLRGLEWWWWWQWKRAHTRNRTRLKWAHNDPLRLADSAAQRVAVETSKSLAPGLAAVAELISILGVDQLVAFVLVYPFLVPFLFQVHDEVSQMTDMTFGAVCALLVVTMLGVVCWCLVCCWKYCQSNDNNNDNDSSDENSDLYL